MRARLHTNSSVLLNKLTAAAESLRRVSGVQQPDVATSLYRFVAQQGLERTESSVVSRQGQVRIVSHEGQFELFESNQAVGMNKPEGQLVPEVKALVSDVFVQPGNGLPGILAVLAALLTAGHFALRLAQVGLPLPEPAGVINRRPIRQGQQAQEAHVTANRGQAVQQKRLQGVRALKLQEYVPARRLALDHDVLDLCAVGQEAMHLDLETAHILHDEDEAVSA